jgi:hypothetical protein
MAVVKLKIHKRTRHAASIRGLRCGSPSELPQGHERQQSRADLILVHSLGAKKYRHGVSSPGLVLTQPNDKGLKDRFAGPMSEMRLFISAS